MNSRPATRSPNNPALARQPPDFEPIQEAKRLLRTIGAGTLATLDPVTGFPFASLVNVATAMDGSPVMLLSDLAAHSKHIAQNPNVSLLLADKGRGDAMTHPRLTLTGTAAKTIDPFAKSRFLRRHPKARLYADFTDFSMVRLQVRTGHLNGGFARAARLSARDILIDSTAMDALIAAEAAMVAAINHHDSASIATLARTLLGLTTGSWRVVGLDPDGCDLKRGQSFARLIFPGPVAAPQGWRTMLARLLERPGPLSNEP